MNHVPVIGPFFEDPEKTYAPPYLDDEAFAVATSALICVCVDIALVDEEGRFVLAFRKKAAGKGWWCMGGRQLVGEVPTNAAKRLLKRETGFAPKKVRHLATFHHFWDERNELPADLGRHDLIQLHTVRVAEEAIARIVLDPEEYDAAHGLMRYDGSQDVREAIAAAYRIYRRTFEYRWLRLKSWFRRWLSCPWVCDPA